MTATIKFGGFARLFSLLVGLSLLTVAATVAAADLDRYPSRPVKVILPFPAGTVTDSVTRLMSERLSQRLGQAFVVENKPGGNGSIGSTHVARSTADGYTLLFTTNTTHSIIGSLLKKVPYDAQRDFTPVVKLAGLPSMVIVGPALQVKSIGDFVTQAKTNSGKIRYGFGNSSGQIGGELLRRGLGIEMVAVPYKGNPQAVQDLLGGHIEAMVVDISTGLPFVRSGKVRALAVLTENRMDVLPEVPTLNETLSPGNDNVAWFGVFGPAGMAPEIVNTLAREMNSILEEPAVSARLRASGVIPSFLAPAAFTPFLAREQVRWTTLAKNAGITPE